MARQTLVNTARKVPTTSDAAHNKLIPGTDRFGNRVRSLFLRGDAYYMQAQIGGKRYLRYLRSVPADTLITMWQSAASARDQRIAVAQRLLHKDMTLEQIESVLGDCTSWHRIRDSQTSNVGLNYEFPDGSIQIHLRQTGDSVAGYRYDGVGAHVIF